MLCALTLENKQAATRQRDVSALCVCCVNIDKQTRRDPLTLRVVV